MTPSLLALPLVARAPIPTPIGDLTALVTANGLAALLFEGDKYHRDDHSPVPLDPDHPHIRTTNDWMAAYWRGEAPPVDGVPLDLHGSLFQRAVWQVLLQIPQGRTWTYGEVATRVGSGAMPRATGTAIGRNPVALIVPCHRVIGANGSLTGYASGLPRKQHLLQHEGVLLT